MEFFQTSDTILPSAAHLILAHQYLHQLEPDIQHSVFGNAATLIAFRLGAEDAPILAREFQPRFAVEDLINLQNRTVTLKLMIEGMPSRPFSAIIADG